MRKGNGEMRKTRLLYGVIALLVVLLLAGGFLGYKKYDELKKENAKLLNPEESAKAEADRIKSQVESIIDVPKDQTPVIYTVTDAGKLKNQAFFANAENGDKALFYESAKRAVLYRPSTNKIINVSNIDVQPNAAKQEQTDGTTNNASDQPLQTQPAEGVTQEP